MEKPWASEATQEAIGLLTAYVSDYEDEEGWQPIGQEQFRQAVLTEQGDAHDDWRKAASTAIGLMNIAVLLLYDQSKRTGESAVDILKRLGTGLTRFES